MPATKNQTSHMQRIATLATNHLENISLESHTISFTFVTLFAFNLRQDVDANSMDRFLVPSGFSHFLA